MSSSIVRVPTWNIDDSENFLAVVRDEVFLYGVSPKINNGYKQLVSRIGFDGISCFSFSPTYQGLTVVGQINGTASIFDIKNNERPSVKLGLKQARPCNSVCFNNNGLVALGVDKSRSDHSLHVYNISDYASSLSSSSASVGQINPEYSLLPNEAVSSVAFYNDMPQVLLIGSYKFLRQIDLREAPTCSVQYATKCVYGISPDPFNPNYYASYSEDGTTVIWDRRYLKNNMIASNSTLTLTKLFNDVNRKSLSSGLSSKFKYCTTRRGEFSVLHNGDLLRRWQFDTAPKQVNSMSHNNNAYDFKHYGASSSACNNTPGMPMTSLGRSSNTQNRLDGPFIAGVIDIKTDFDRVASFDYSLDFRYRDVVNYMCIRQSGQVFRMGVVESADSVKFDPCNNIAVAAIEGVYFEESGVEKIRDSENVEPSMPGQVQVPNTHNNNSNSARFNDDLESLDGHESVSSIEFEKMYNATTVLQRDISVIMRNRALAGYSLDPEKNFELLDPKIKVTNDISLSPSNFGSLRQVWRWVDIAHNYDKNKVMQENYLDLGLEGVLGIWEGFAGMSEEEKKCRVKKGADESNRGFKREVETIVKKVTPLIYTAPLGVRTKNSSNLKSAISNEIGSEPQRQMCLIVAGWDFPHSKLDEKLNKLVESGQYEKAAGWAVFHGDVKKAVTILGQSSKERLKLISTSIAGYFAYKDSPDNSMWRDRCRELAFEFDNCYLRAIFSYISEESWSEVLDDSTLPLREKLGIAFRFLPEDVLSKYLKSLVYRAIERGDLEGLILTGLSPRSIDLLQSYVDRTGDVQTAALLTSYGYPRFFRDARAEYWIDSYKTLLNAWRMFSQRARFDIARNKLSYNSDNQCTLEPYPKQVYLRCSHCNKNIIRPSSNQATSNSSATGAGAGSKRNLLRSTGEQTTRCPHCNNPLPRCSVCLNSLGSSVPLTNISISPSSDTGVLSAPERQFERWFSFCLSCNHGAHIGHAREWFKKHKICPVPDCNCNCNDK
ncbi:hypothetical protein NADFUDRAFT_50797 [Nadsonia fulvescens var. elongata DSM 6958]|uniref:Uncharacterized protein n=1 Tax=Nadsonia fulvescens var. elongata DSM 6958 TaxID=857566 RepID=A0A1E3PJC3_9ASCO|nr:hypothetical protein NADFUDRAFT_50797 [Nadsonia fulvescens var. elongata DSM 6958]